jgi:hypothetical protein
MAFNLFLAYDLIPPGQKYDDVQLQIKKLGPWYKLQYSLFYVHSELDCKASHDFVRLAMDANDNLTVVEAVSAFVSSVPIADLEALRSAFAHGPKYIAA